MSAKPLSESTLTLKKIVSKKEATNDDKLSNSINEAIRCLVNASSSKSKHVLVNVTINVVSVEMEEKENKNVVTIVSEEPPAMKSEEFENKVIIINDEHSNHSNTSDSTTEDIVGELVQLEELELSKNTPIKNLHVNERKNENANEGNNSSPSEAMKIKLNKSTKVNNCEVAEVDKQCLDRLNVALRQRLKNRRLSASIMQKKLLEELKTVKDKKKKNKISNNKQHFSVNDDVDCTRESLNKKRKSGEL